MVSLPYSQACENNKQPILARLKEVFVGPGTALEVGSGTGQHAVYFAAALPHLTWQPS
ncbi:MAG TPA: methylase, partial [Halieaceae bacterium]|nr:methylase [Halieaceae bacterium]